MQLIQLLKSESCLIPVLEEPFVKKKSFITYLKFLCVLGAFFSLFWFFRETIDR